MSFVVVVDPNCAASYGDNKILKEGCGLVTIDINGYNRPNQYGVDLFTFIMTKNSIIPQGAQVETFFTFEKYCNKTQSFADNGRSCAAWVIYNENMDYLKCNDLSWSGKRRCG